MQRVHIIFYLYKNTYLENKNERLINVLYFLHLTYIFYNFYKEFVLLLKFESYQNLYVGDLPLNTSVQTCRINCSENSLPCIKLLRVITLTYQVKSNRNMKTVKEAEYIRASHLVLGVPEDLLPRVAPGDP